jgi:predicted NUDIX family phosphoesterase
MSEPSYRRGLARQACSQSSAARCTAHSQSTIDHGVNVTARDHATRYGQEARANADRELREALDLAYEMRDDECAGINYGCNSVQAFDAARAERKS